MCLFGVSIDGGHKYKESGKKKKYRGERRRAALVALGALAEAQLLLTPAQGARLAWSGQYGSVGWEGTKVSDCPAAVADRRDKALSVRVKVGVAVEIGQRGIASATLDHLENSFAGTGAV